MARFCKVCGRPHDYREHGMNPQVYGLIPRVFPDTILDVYWRRSDLQATFPNPLDFSAGSPKHGLLNFAHWVALWGINTEPQIQAHYNEEADKKFLSILLRTHKRPNILETALTSIAEQTRSQDCIVVIISDDPTDNLQKAINKHPNLNIVVRYVTPLGYPKCNIYYNMVGPTITSEYITFLDDDDEILDKEYIEGLMEIASDRKPPIILTRVNMNPVGIVPDEAHWEKKPAPCHISGLGVVVRSDYFHTSAWKGQKRGDYHYITSIIDKCGMKDVHWWDNVTHIVRRPAGRGRHEEEF